MAKITVQKIMREEKTVPDMSIQHIVITKQKDRIVISLDPKLCKQFEDREAFMEKLMTNLVFNGTIDEFVRIMNKDDEDPL